MVSGVNIMTVRLTLRLPEQLYDEERAANLTGRVAMPLRTLDAIQLQNAIEFSEVL